MVRWIKLLTCLMLSVLIFSASASDIQASSSKSNVEKLKIKIDAMKELYETSEINQSLKKRFIYYNKLENALLKYENDQELNPEDERILELENIIGTSTEELDEQGGPDEFGYVYIDSQEEGGPGFNWIDIADTGELITGLDNDVTLGPYDIGFNFPFYGETYDEFYLCAHGWISFTSTGVTWINSNLPDAFEPNNLIAFYWDDFIVDWANGAYYETIDDMLIVQWDHTSAPCQVQISESGLIQIMYDEGFTGPLGGVTGETIGIENEDGSIGLEVSYNTDPADYPFGELAISFSNTAYNLSGHVETEDGDPVEGAYVYILEAPAYHGESDEFGDYEFDLYDNDDQPFTVVCHADGYEHAEVGGVEWDNEDDDQVVDFVLIEVDPRTPPSIRYWDGYSDTGVFLQMDEPGSYEHLLNEDELEGEAELDEFLGFNAFYSLDAGETWNQHNEELILEDVYDVSLGSDFENTEFLVYISAMVDSEGVEIESDPSLSYEVMFNMPPEAPSNLQVTDINNAELSATITWNPPDENEDGSDLVDLAEYRLYRDGEFHAIIPANQGAMFEDQVPIAGYYAYSIHARDEVPNISGEDETDPVRIGLPPFWTSFEPDMEPEQPNPFDHEGITWAWGSPQFGPNGGYDGTDYCWATVLNAFYVNGQQDDLESTYAWVVLGNPFISYYHWMQFMWGDGYNLKVSDDNRNTWTVVEPVGGYDGTITGLGGENGFSGMEGAWEEVQFDLSAYAESDSIHIKFSFGADDWNNAYGVAIDHLEIWGVRPDNYGCVEGFVLDHEDQPLQGARIYLEEIPRFEAFTNENGYYFLINAPADTFNIVCDYPFYWPQTAADFIIPDADTVSLDFTNDSGMPMLFPDGELETTALELYVNIHEEFGDTTGQEEFIIESVGSGQLDWNAYVRVIYGPDFTGNRGNELDETWDIIAGIDVQSTTANEGITGAVVTADSIYVSARYMDEETGDNFLYSFNHQGNLFYSYPYPVELLDGDGAGVYDIAYNPDEQVIYGANSDGDVFQFSPDFSDFSIVTSVNFGPNAVAYDMDNHRLFLREWNSDFAFVDITSGEVTVLDIEPQERHVSGMAYMPLDPDGFNIWLIAHDSANLGQGGYVFKYNPETMAYDMNTIEVYPAEENSSSAGMDISMGWRNDYWHITTVHQTPVDYVDIWEGIYSPPSWIWIEPSSGNIDPGEERQIELVADLRKAEDIQEFEEGMEMYAEIVFGGNRWANPPVMDITIVVISIEDDVSEGNVLPEKYTLYQNYPNPFNPKTTIRFDLVENQHVSLIVYDILGREVTSLVDQRMDPGYHRVSFDASRLASGIYFYEVKTGNFKDMRKMILIK